MQTVTYYRVDLRKGITVEDRRPGFYRNDPELGRTVFKNLRRAKAVLSRMVKAEIQRLRDMHRTVRPLTKRSDLKEHSYSPEPDRAEGYGAT